MLQSIWPGCNFTYDVWRTLKYINIKNIPKVISSFTDNEYATISCIRLLSVFICHSTQLQCVSMTVLNATQILIYLYCSNELTVQT